MLFGPTRWASGLADPVSLVGLLDPLDSPTSSFNILSLVVVIFLCQRVIDPLVGRTKKSDSKGLTGLQWMGIGLVIATMAMVSTGIVGCYGLKYAIKECTKCEGSSSLVLRHLLANSTGRICRRFWSFYVCSRIGVLQCVDSRSAKELALEVHFACYLSHLGTTWVSYFCACLWIFQLRITCQDGTQEISTKVTLTGFTFF